MAPAEPLLDHRGRPRCVITGLGALTGDGIGVDAVWASFVREVDAPVRGTVSGFNARDWLTRKEAARSAPFLHFGVAAADEAMAMAGSPEFEPRRAGVVMSTIYGALETIELERMRFETGGPESVDSYYGAMACENATAAALAQRFQLRGPCKAVLGACAGGGFAVADAVELIRSGRCDAVLAGASQSMMTPTMQASYTNLRVLAEDGWCRPFDARRRGFVFGEGAAVLVVERLETALARGAEPIAEVVGWGNTNDAANLVRPSGEGAIECIEDALADAGLEADAITSINAHGTGTVMNDLVEAQAIEHVFGARPIPVSSIKRVSGHLAGASGALEAVAVALAMREALLPPTAIDFEPDPEIRLDVVTGKPLEWQPGPTISNSFGLAGHNCTLVLAPCR